MVKVPHLSLVVDWGLIFESTDKLLLSDGRSLHQREALRSQTGISFEIRTWAGQRSWRNREDKRTRKDRIGIKHSKTQVYFTWFVLGGTLSSPGEMPITLVPSTAAHCPLQPCAGPWAHGRASPHCFSQEGSLLAPSIWHRVFSSSCQVQDRAGIRFSGSGSLLVPGRIGSCRELPLNI